MYNKNQILSCFESNEGPIINRNGFLLLWLWFLKFSHSFYS